MCVQNNPSKQSKQGQVAHNQISQFLCVYTTSALRQKSTQYTKRINNTKPGDGNQIQTLQRLINLIIIHIFLFDFDTHEPKHHYMFMLYPCFTALVGHWLIPPRCSVLIFMCEHSAPHTPGVLVLMLVCVLLHVFPVICSVSITLSPKSVSLSLRCFDVCSVSLYVRVSLNVFSLC